MIAVAVEPKTQADQEKMGIALGKLAREDPSFRVSTDEESGQTIIRGMGELHLEIIVDRMKREFGVEANVGKPQVAYRETIREAVEQEGKFVRQSGGREQYGHVWLRIEPLPAGKGYEFVERDRRRRRAEANTSRPSTRACAEQVANGVVAGYPVVDVKVTIFDGDASRRRLESRSRSRSRARSRSRKARRKARPVLLEPIMNVEVVTPEDYMGDVNGDLSRRRGMLHGLEDSPAGKIVRAQVPLSEMFGYATRAALDEPGPRDVHDGVLALRRSAEQRRADRSSRIAPA